MFLTGLDALEDDEGDFEYYERVKCGLQLLPSQPVRPKEERRKRHSVTNFADDFEYEHEGPNSKSKSKSHTTNTTVQKSKKPLIAIVVPPVELPAKKDEEEVKLPLIEETVETTMEAYNLTPEEVLTSRASPLTGIDMRVASRSTIPNFVLGSD